MSKQTLYLYERLPREIVSRTSGTAGYVSLVAKQMREAGYDVFISGRGDLGGKIRRGCTVLFLARGQRHTSPVHRLRRDGGITVTAPLGYMAPLLGITSRDVIGVEPEAEEARSS